MGVSKLQKKPVTCINLDNVASSPEMLKPNNHWHQYAAKQAKKVNSKCLVVKNEAASSTTNNVPVYIDRDRKKKKKKDK